MPFDTISHVSHVQYALDIIRDGVIAPRLVRDKSILQTRRTPVVWLSPKRWGTGWRYGNIEFVLDWKTTVRGMNFYWVETLDYSIPAPRILVTPKKYGDLKHYPPTDHDGPWWYDSRLKKHYYCDKYAPGKDCCVEILLEREVRLDEVRAVKYVAHSDTYCALNRDKPTACPDFERQAQPAGALFVAGLVARDLQARSLLAIAEGKNIDLSELGRAWNCIVHGIAASDDDSGGSIAAESPEASAVARARLAAYSREDDKDKAALAALFASRAALRASLAGLVREHFGLSAGTLT